MRTAGLAFVAAVAVALAPVAHGSALPANPVDPTITSGKAARDLAAARARWKAGGINSYRFRVQRSCFCNPKQGQATITVRGGRPGAIENALDVVATVPRVFRVVADAIENKSTRLTVTYDAKRGFVRHVYIDRVAQIADEEVGYDVTKFTPLP